MATTDRPIDEDPRAHLRRWTAELIGTFALVTVAAGGEMVGALFPDKVDHVARSAAPGLLVMAFVYALGDASGAHFNPAVTLAFAAKRLFPWRWVPTYWFAQVAGALLAAALLRAVIGDVAAVGSSRTAIAAGPAVVIEALLTWLLVTVILGTSDRYRIVGPNAAVAVGATIALCGLWAGPLTGASMNPARSIGPAIVSGRLDDVWIWIVGPAIGALLAVATTVALHGTARRDREQIEAAQGTPAETREATTAGPAEPTG